MKQKLWELGAKLQIKKGLASLASSSTRRSGLASLSPRRSGSILVYTLIIMMIMLSTALSIFAVAVREKKGAGTTAASMQAFAVADSGSEIALNKIANVSTLAEVGICADGGVVTGSIGTGMDYTLTFYDSGGNQLLDCTDSVSAVDKVKSVGRYGGTARAVEVAVAQTGSCQWYQVNNDCGGSGCIIDIAGGAGAIFLANATQNQVCQIKNGGWAEGIVSYGGQGYGRAWEGDSWGPITSCSGLTCFSWVYCCNCNQ